MVVNNLFLIFLKYFQKKISDTKFHDHELELNEVLDNGYILFKIGGNIKRINDVILYYQYKEDAEDIVDYLEKDIDPEEGYSEEDYLPYIIKAKTEPNIIDFDNSFQNLKDEWYFEKYF